MSSESLHDPCEPLTVESKDLHRAIVSLKEELEAVDWYQQRAEACSDSELRAVLVHNKNEEIEHAIMILEWLRRHCPVFAENISKYLNSGSSLVEAEWKQTGSPRLPNSLSSLGIGSLQEVK